MSKKHSRKKVRAVLAKTYVVFSNKANTGLDPYSRGLAAGWADALGFAYDLLNEEK